MRVLYAIQGTGTGHVARATEVVPVLKRLADTDVLISGCQADLSVPFTIDYRFQGLSFIFGKKGGVSVPQTISHLHPAELVVDIRHLPVEDYDLVISDFEPVSAWACLLKRKHCIGLSHQAAVAHPKAPRPSLKDPFGELVLKHYAPAYQNLGFHFASFAPNIFTPVIRRGIRGAEPTNGGHFTVYLPAYSDEEIHHTLSKIPQVEWHVFSKHSKQTCRRDNLFFRPVSLEEFTQSFVSCAGILCTAGFETPAEALFMGKKLAVIPMTNQYEQHCNAAFLQTMGVPVLHKLAGSAAVLKQWIDGPEMPRQNYADQTEEILSDLLARYA